MKSISNAELVQAGQELLAQATSRKIPYVKGGMSLAGMDCQGLIEYLLIQCGMSAKECGLAGSNAHWRKSLKWSGTPEEAKKIFGCVPAGACLFIWTGDDSGAPAQYRGDGYGDANHMGLYLGGKSAVHASASRECVAESVFRGKTIPNGGWNRVGLLKWVRYGTRWEAEMEGGEDDGGAGEADSGGGAGGGAGDGASAASGANGDGGGGADRAGGTSGGSGGGAGGGGARPVDTSEFYTVKRGCKGGAVRRLQTWLCDLGYGIGESGVDGDFGAATLEAVRQFQTDKGLIADGVVGQRTWAVLAEARGGAMG
ncbi:MAG: peptidoglycan-binding domain-containing protein [Clostridia bacterium]